MEAAAPAAAAIEVRLAQHECFVDAKAGSP
jgi:hypothetical protein